MKNYFGENECEGTDDGAFLRGQYNKADKIFEKRFDNGKEKTKALEDIIEEVNTHGYTDEIKCSKMISLVLGNTYMRLAQCQNELLKKSRQNYHKAIGYMEEYIDNSNMEEIDLLLMLNKGKYYRNTAEVGRKSDYERALGIFRDVAENVKKVNINAEKKLHLLLDAKINIGRVSRYSYAIEEARNIFLSLILSLEVYVDKNIKGKLHESEVLTTLLCEVKPDRQIEESIQNVKKENIEPYIGEYLLQSLIHIGIIFRKKKEYRNAIEIFTLINSIDTEENNIDACNNLGVCFRKLGDLNRKKDIKESKKNYESAKKEFEKLKIKGNKFARINYYKCKLDINETECREVIKEITDDEEASINSLHVKLILGRAYIKIEDYDNAIKCFEEIYRQNNHIARGSLGLKAYYNLARCKICKGEFRSANKILGKIRHELKRNHNYTDNLTEIDYGWCLMQEGIYDEALSVYDNLLKTHENEFDRKQKMMVYNNIADCQLHLGEWQKAEEYISKVLEVEKTNKKALYLQGIIFLEGLLTGKNSDYRKVYNHFCGLLGNKSSEININSGWLISAVLLYKHNGQAAKDIVTRIKYSEKPVSMKSFCYLAEFVLRQLESSDIEDLCQGTLYRDFCHMKLDDCGENRAFQNLMGSIDFHYFSKEDRAFILAHIVQMYKYILRIKDECRFTYKEKEKTSMPCHYTKLSTLNCLLVKDGKEPRLRLWNSAYMNDRYEGGVFRNLLREAALSSEDVIVKEEKDSLENYFGNSIYSWGQSDSNVYITSFSMAKDSFQMWNIYGDNEKGVAIEFDREFFDIRNSYQDLVWDGKTDEYALYKVNYQNELQGEIKKVFEQICYHICWIENRLKKLKSVETEPDEKQLLASAEREVRTFIADRLNEVRFLYKEKSYEYEKEMRLVRVSHKCEIDNKNFSIPRLYIDVDREIENLEIVIGGKLTNQEVNDLSVWLENSGKVKEIKVSNFNKLYAEMAQWEKNDQ